MVVGTYLDNTVIAPVNLRARRTLSHRFFSHSAIVLAYLQAAAEYDQATGLSSRAAAMARRTRSETDFERVFFMTAAR